MFSKHNDGEQHKNHYCGCKVRFTKKTNNILAPKISQISKERNLYPFRCYTNTFPLMK